MDVAGTQFPVAVSLPWLFLPALQCLGSLQSMLASRERMAGRATVLRIFTLLRKITFVFCILDSRVVRPVLFAIRGQCINNLHGDTPETTRKGPTEIPLHQARQIFLILHKRRPQIYTRYLTSTSHSLYVSYKHFFSSFATRSSEIRRRIGNIRLSLK